ncbi:MAG: aspartate kinase [SAR324 cluster bacterium]|nr:aspartate kinase [SAR324 cluster bacterium]
MSLIVQKFGGTSLGTPERLLGVSEIIQNSAKQHSVVSVVSAMSSVKKSEGTTSRLIQAGAQALTGEDYSVILDQIESSHVDVLEKVINNKGLRTFLETEIHSELQNLKSFLEAICVIQEISPRSQDLIVGTGERLSAQVLAGILRDRGVDAVYTNLSEIGPQGIDSLNPRFNQVLQKLMSDQLPENSKAIPVVTGFFGFVKGGIIKTVGRGYTDFTAALLAGKLGAEELQVWKEVDGIFSADPNKVPKAKVLDHIFPNEAAELTYFGSEVLHPFTMECAIANSVPVRIKNTFHPERPGTVILPEIPTAETVAQYRPSGKSAIAVTTKGNITVINIYSNRMLHSSGFMAKVYETFSKHNVVIDLVSTSEVNISCTVDRSSDLGDLIEDLKRLGSVTVFQDRAILSLVGNNMKHVPGVAGKMFTALADQGINIEMITQGASEINISCVITEVDSIRALNAIHHTFLE